VIVRVRVRAERSVLVSVGFLCMWLMVSSVRDAKAMHDRALIHTKVPIVDAIKTPDGKVRLFTQDFQAYDADPALDAWVRKDPTFLADSSTFSLRRIGRILHVGNVVLAGGHVIGQVSGRDVTAVLRSTDNGYSFQVIEVGEDTLGMSDGVGLSQDGMVFFVDRVGRMWTSNDTGRSWNQTTFTRPIPPGSIRELDMVNRQLGVGIDVQRQIYLTMNGWQKIITPVPASRPIRRTQPTFLDEFKWNRNLVLWDNYLILVEGPDIYRTPSNDLIWERWDNVVRYDVSADRRSIAYYDTHGKLYTTTSFAAAPVLIADDLLQPDFIRHNGNTIIVYRPDTGPILFENGKRTMIRPYHPTEAITAPEFSAKSKSGQGWGVDSPMPIGPIRKVQVLEKDTVILGDYGNKHRYDPVKKSTSSFTISNPLDEFLRDPVVRFRVVIAADELDSTHVSWAEFRPVDKQFRCAEIVDSSRFGVKSDLVDIRIDPELVRTTLERVNKHADQAPSKDLIDLSPETIAAYERLLDTIFVYDAYFNTFDLYIPPPDPLVQIDDCRQRFRKVTDTIGQVSNATIEEAILAWRHLPRDEFSRYAVQFENRRGLKVAFSVERTDEAHPPMMTPWVGKHRGWSFHVFDRGLTDLVIRGMAPNKLPAQFKVMAGNEWLLAAVASYLDRRQHGRWHRWMKTEVTPGARR